MPFRGDDGIYEEDFIEVGVLLVSNHLVIRQRAVFFLSSGVESCSELVSVQENLFFFITPSINI